jgi:hypothetical protein
VALFGEADRSRRAASRDGAGLIRDDLEVRRDSRPALWAGTLACVRCDAPVALGPEPLSPSAPLRCPYCDHRGPLHTFLTLGAPTRPARVVVRVTRPSLRPRG